MRKNETNKKALEQIKKEILNINYKALDKDKEEDLRGFLKSIDYFSNEFCTEAPEKLVNSAIKEFSYYKREKPYIISGFNIFKPLEFEKYDNRISNIFRDIYNEIDLSSFSDLDELFIEELRDCIISIMNQEINNVISDEDGYVHDFNNSIEQFIVERDISQKYMIYLYNMYKNERFVYVDKIYKIHEYSCSDPIDEESVEEILISRNTGVEVILEDAEDKLSKLISNTFWELRMLLYDEFNNKYEDYKELLVQLLIEKNDNEKIFDIDIEDTNEVEQILIRCFDEVWYVS